MSDIAWPVELKDFVDRHSKMPNRSRPRTIRAYTDAKCVDGEVTYGTQRERVTSPLYGHPMVVKQGEKHGT